VRVDGIIRIDKDCSISDNPCPEQWGVDEISIGGVGSEGILFGKDLRFGLFHFLQDLPGNDSRLICRDELVKKYPDVIALGFTAFDLAVVALKAWAQRCCLRKSDFLPDSSGWHCVSGSQY